MPFRRPAFACLVFGWMAAAGLMAALLTACAAPPPAAEDPDDPVIYVVQRGWHTDIGLSAEAISGPLATLKAAFPGVGAFTFGFGERQFLVTRKPSIWTMLNALLPSRSALLVTALRATPQDAFGDGDVVELHVSRAGLQRIEATLWDEFETSADGAPLRLADGPYPGSVFYAARQTYDLLFTCNSWTAETLRAGGLAMPATGAGVVLSDQVMGMARWIGARHAR
ncbi:MAG TPA: DUF2459 domain-containing protein [Rhodopila sp.]